jgi:hypothetical protein
MIKILLSISILFLNFSVFSQATVMKNYGNLTMHNGSHLYIDGSVENSPSGNIVVNGTFETIGNILNSGSISSNNAGQSLGSMKFTGGNNQTLGSSSQASLSVDEINLNKTGGELKILTNITTSKIVFDGGDINASGNTITVGNSVNNIGIIQLNNQNSGVLNGKIKRWFANSTNTTTNSGVFPLKTADGQKRNVVVNYTTAPTSGGTLEASWVNSPMGTDGLLTSITAVGNGCSGSYLLNGSANGYWLVDDANGLNGGIYSILLEGDNVAVSYDGLDAYNFVDPCQVTAVKRQGNNPWGISGTHVSNSGSETSPKILISGAQGWSNWGFAGQSSSPLPVELLSFNGECQENMININWSTASENNSSYFDIEKSEDGEDWIKIATVEAAGNSNSLINYNIQDFRKSYSSNLYYRLNQFDVDGKNEVFGPILIVCEPDLSIDSEINLFPNPNNGDFQLVVNSKEDNVEITMIITDTYGRKVSSINNTLQSGINLYSFSNLNLNSGVYYIKILSNGDLMNSTRLIVNSIK